MKTGSSEWQWGHITRSADDGAIVKSPAQVRHLKCIIALMKPLLVMMLMAVVVQAQSIADVARKERERQSKLKPARVITSIESLQAAEPKPTTTEDAEATAPEAKPEAQAAVPKPEPATAQSPVPDPVVLWNSQLSQLRTRIRTLQDQEAALLLQLNDANNLVYALVTDPATQERALTQVGQIQQQLAALRVELDTAKKTLDSLVLQGPPKQ